jgi:IS30 family transposase
MRKSREAKLPASLDGCSLPAMAERKTRKYIIRLLPGKGPRHILRTRIQAGRKAQLSARAGSQGWMRHRARALRAAFGAIEAAERAINALPRRILGCRAPEAPFEAELDRLYGAPV